MCAESSDSRRYHGSMSLERGFSWSYQDLNFVGYSLAGITTSVYFKNAGICFDVGQGLPFHVGARRFCLTHGHLDHSGGMPYILSQRNMMGQKETDIFVPREFAPLLREIIGLWARAEGNEYSYALHVAEPGRIFELDKLYALKSFPTVHRVPSQGYLVYRKRKRLKPDFHGLDAEALRKLRASGENPEEHFLEPLAAFTGDTRIEFLELDREVTEAKILFLEVTFWDEAKTVEHARRWGHIHLDELIQALPRLKNERIVLLHSSVRYPVQFLERVLRERVGDCRVELFPRA